MVKTTASKAIGNKLTVCNRAVKGLDADVKNAIIARRKRHTKGMHQVQLLYDRMGGICCG